MNDKRSMQRVILLRLFNNLQEEYGLGWSLEVLLDSSGGHNHQLEAAVAFKSNFEIDGLHVALHRLSTSTYGICLSCNGSVPRDILIADPTMRLPVLSGTGAVERSPFVGQMVFGGNPKSRGKTCIWGYSLIIGQKMAVFANSLAASSLLPA